MKTIEQLEKDIKRTYKEIEVLRKDYANEWIIGKAFGYPDSEYYCYAFECPDGKNIRCIVVQVYSQWMGEESLPLKSDVFKSPIDTQVFIQKVESMKDYFIKLTRKEL